jgi:hypothetical protein
VPDRTTSVRLVRNLEHHYQEHQRGCGRWNNTPTYPSMKKIEKILLRWLTPSKRVSDLQLTIITFLAFMFIGYVVISFMSNMWVAQL